MHGVADILASSWVPRQLRKAPRLNPEPTARSCPRRAHRPGAPRAGGSAVLRAPSLALRNGPEGGHRLRAVSARRFSAP